MAVSFDVDHAGGEYQDQNGERGHARTGKYWLTRAVFNSVVTGNHANTANVNNVTVMRVYGTIGPSWVSSRVIN